MTGWAGREVELMGTSMVDADDEMTGAMVFEGLKDVMEVVKGLVKGLVIVTVLSQLFEESGDEPRVEATLVTDDVVPAGAAGDTDAEVKGELAPFDGESPVYCVFV